MANGKKKNPLEARLNRRLSKLEKEVREAGYATTSSVNRRVSQLRKQIEGVGYMTREQTREQVLGEMPETVRGYLNSEEGRELITTYLTGENGALDLSAYARTDDIPQSVADFLGSEGGRTIFSTAVVDFLGTEGGRDVFNRYLTVLFQEQAQREETQCSWNWENVVEGATLGLSRLWSRRRRE